jgi:RNA polymerase sigma-70 factor (ECF subfamily)
MCEHSADFWNEFFCCPRSARCQGCRCRAAKILRAAKEVIEGSHRDPPGVCHAIPPREVPNLPAYMARAYWIAYDILLNDADALDAVAEALLIVTRHPREPDDFEQTLYYTTRLKALDLLRRRRRRKGEVSFDEECHYPSASDDGEEMSDHLVALREAMKKLPAQSRRLLEMRYFGGKGLAEMASELGLTYETVNMRLHKARQMLKRMLEPAYAR